MNNNLKQNRLYTARKNDSVCEILCQKSARTARNVRRKKKKIFLKIGS